MYLDKQSFPSNMGSTTRACRLPSVSLPLSRLGSKTYSFRGEDAAPDSRAYRQRSAGRVLERPLERKSADAMHAST